MTKPDTGVSPADLVADALIAGGYDLIAGTPCGVLGPVLARIESRTGTMRYLHREDTAIAFAAGIALAGAGALLLMQNSGLGQSVNVLASLVRPFGVPLALVVSLRGTGPDPTHENLGMGRATQPIMAALDIPHRVLDAGGAASSVDWLNRTALEERRPAALLVPPELFGWSADR